MKKILILLVLSFSWGSLHAEELNESLAKITNFHFVSPKLASSGLLDLKQYQYIEKYGFKHVVNLIPGDQTEERKHVQSLGLSYEQIEVDWSEPTLDDFERFTKLLKSYGEDNVYVHCEANYRASTFVFLYRILHLNVKEADAKKDLMKIWKPSETWRGFIEKVLFDHQD